MLSKEQVESLLVMRLLACSESCNSHHINHVDGQIRALVAVLTEEPPPVFQSGTQILDAVGIPYDSDGDTFEIEESWLLAHGFVISSDDISHPGIPAW